jgi:hypothetical protein
MVGRKSVRTLSASSRPTLLRELVAARQRGNLERNAGSWNRVETIKGRCVSRSRASPLSRFPSLAELE